MEGDVGTRHGLARDEGPVDDDAAGHVAEEAPGPGRLRQRPEVSVGCRPVLLPEEAPDELGVLAHRGAQVGQDDAGLGRAGRQVRLELRGVEQQLDVARERVQRGAAPLLLLAGRRRGGRQRAPTTARGGRAASRARRVGR